MTAPGRQLRAQPGVTGALVAAALFGLSAPLAKLLLRDAPPQLLAGLLYLGSGTGLALFWTKRRSGKREATLTRNDAPWLAGAILFGGGLAPVLLMAGLSRTPASGASLLLNLEGVFTAALAWLVFRENFDRRIALGMVAIVAGGVLLSWEGHLAWGGLAGPLMVVGACLAWGIDNNLTQKISAGDPVQIAMVKGLAAGTVNTAIALALGARWPSVGVIGSALVLGLLSYGVSLVLFVLALRQLGTARTGAYFSTAPFVGAAVSLLVFRERPALLFIAAAGCMALGVWLHLTERHEHDHVHEEIDHAHAHVHDDHHRHAHTTEMPPVTDPIPHAHPHLHGPMIHLHGHYPDIHHRHDHE